MTDLHRAGYRDVVEVTEEGHRRCGERFHVISGMAGIGSRFIHACVPDNHAECIGLRHDQVVIVGQVPFGVDVPMM